MCSQRFLEFATPSPTNTLPIPRRWASESDKPSERGT